MTKLVGILGYPLAHSISPAFQQAACDHYSLPARYEAWPVPPENLEAGVRKLRDESYLGANVTVPHKEKVKAFLDHIDPWAKSIGAVNTIVREGDRLVGYNTDAYGFIRSLKDMGQFDPRGKNVVILGAGGAARAAVFGLAQEGVASLTIANRTIARAQALADEVRGSVASISAVSMADADLKQAAAGADLIVNSTSIGMRHGDAEGLSPVAASFIPSHALVYDMVYNPEETPLLVEARKAGARTLGGLPMLIYQGAAAFERWTGREAPVDVMFEAGKKALTETITGR
jgi:shikimate dehydrogenase